MIPISHGFINSTWAINSPWSIYNFVSKPSISFLDEAYGDLNFGYLAQFLESSVPSFNLDPLHFDLWNVAC